jgi:hypothetical protein
MRPKIAENLHEDVEQAPHNGHDCTFSSDAGLPQKRRFLTPYACDCYEGFLPAAAGGHLAHPFRRRRSENITGQSRFFGSGNGRHAPPF